MVTYCSGAKLILLRGEVTAKKQCNTGRVWSAHEPFTQKGNRGTYECGVQQQDNNKEAHTKFYEREK